MTASEVNKTLDELVGTLEGAVGREAAGAGDAIDEVLKGPGRSTQAVSIRQSPEVDAFRRELIDGLIRVDTVNQVLRLVNEWVVRLLQGA